ncbi:MAG: efflux RND transporter permease subunit [bacterium]|nr:efflux RND transporter permease subunit [bacterium]
MTRLFMRRPVTTWMIFAAFVVLAVYAVPKIEVQALPEIDLPSLTVSTQWNGASPKAIQRSITLPIEEAVRKVHGVESVTSTSRAGRSNVQVEFRRDADLDFARLELNEHLGSVRQNLPLNASQPRIVPFVPEDFQTEQFMTIDVESSLSPNELREYAEKWIVPQLLSVEGVADAQVRGGARPLLKIFLDRDKLDLYGITADTVFAAVDRLDELSGAGAVHQDGVEKLVALRHPVDLERIRNATVAQLGPRTYHLHMLGSVEPAFEDPLYFVRANGDNVIQVQVEKRSGANAVTVSRDLRDAAPRIEERTPGDVSLVVDQDEGKDLEDKLRDLIGRSVIILVLLFLLLAISLRQLQLTTIVIASVVFALVICLSLFYFLDLSVNFITISGLTICFGMLLDNSILVLDSIHRRLEGLGRAEKAGLSRRSAAKVAVETIVRGTGEVMFPIMATTLTTIVAFLSFIFLSGRMALYYVPMAIAVATAMIASIFVAFCWIPVVLNQSWAKRLVRRFADGPNEVDDPAQLATFVEDLPDLEAAPRKRETLLNGMQRLWPLILPGVTALLVWGWFIYDGKVIKGGFWRMPDDEKIIFFMRMPEGTDVQVTSQTMLKFEQAVLPVKDGAKMRASVFGAQAYMEIEFDDKLKQTGIPLLYRSLLTEQADATGGTAIFINGFSEQPYMKGNLRGSALNSLVKITGYNSKRLTEIAETTLAKVKTQRRVRNARITGSERFGSTSTEETVIRLKRDVLAENGLTVIEVVGFVRRLLGVDTPWNMLVAGEQEQVQLSFYDAEEIEFSEVAAQIIESSTGARVRLGELVEMQTLPLSDAVVRENQRYSMLVNWEYVGTDRMRASYIKSVLESMDLPYGYSAEESRREFLTEEEESELVLMIVLAAAFILIVLSALFESVLLPLLVLMSLPLALFGVVTIYWQTTSTFDSSAKIGLVLVFGVVVNNAILLVSRFRRESELVLQARQGGDPGAEYGLFPGLRKALGGSHLWHLPKKERAYLLRRAISRATLVRLRSILLTSGTTIVGLVPLLLAFDWVPMQVGWLFGLELPFTVSWIDAENQDVWQNLALTCVGGLISSTVLILVALPPLYYFCVRFGWMVRSFGGWIAGIPRALRPSPTPADPTSRA